jgi:hypothetical protein
MTGNTARLKKAGEVEEEEIRPYPSRIEFTLTLKKADLFKAEISISWRILKFYIRLVT